MGGLSVFRGECDWVVAKSEDDAWAAWEEATGESRGDYPGDSFVPEPDDKLLTLWRDIPPGDKCDCRQKIQDRQDKIDGERATIMKMPPSDARDELFKGVSNQLDVHPNGHVVGCDVGEDRLTCAEWAKKNGRGFLGSTEY